MSNNWSKIALAENDFTGPCDSAVQSSSGLTCGPILGSCSASRARFSLQLFSNVPLHDFVLRFPLCSDKIFSRSKRKYLGKSSSGSSHPSPQSAGSGSALVKVLCSGSRRQSQVLTWVTRSAPGTALVKQTVLLFQKEQCSPIVH